MLRLDEAAAEPAAGAKAQALARARAAGLPVPDGIVLLPDEEVDERALLAALQQTGAARFAVRSSADVEDRPGASAAGVFESVVGVAADDVPAAIERVRASAGREAARAYLGSRGIGRARLAVLVQPLVEASALGVLHTAPLDGGGFRAEERAPSEPEWGEVAPRRIAPDEPLGRGAAKLAALVGGAADVEYALTTAGPVFLQARPLGAPISVDELGWDPGDDGRWRRDAEHNPDPLSAAQASLVARVADLPGAPAQKILGGFLFVRVDPPTDNPAKAIPPQDLPRRFADEIAPACDAALAPLEADPAPPLAAALDGYRAVLARYLEVGPSLKRARGHLDQLLRANLGEPLEAHGALVGGIGDAAVARDAALWRLGRADPAERPSLMQEYHRRYGAWAPAWDVAVACDDELPTRVMQMAALVGRGPSPELRHDEARTAADAAAAALLGRLDRMARGAFKHLLPVVRAALTVAEADDLLFFRAQRVARRALMALGVAAAVDGRLDDPTLVFDLPIESVERGDLDGARAADARALRMQRRRA